MEKKIVSKPLIEEDYLEVQELRSKEKANEFMKKGWKLIDVYQKQGKEVFVVALPGTTILEEKKGINFKPFFMVAIGIILVSFVVLQNPGFIVTEHNETELALLFAGIALILFGLNQIMPKGEKIERNQRLEIKPDEK